MNRREFAAVLGGGVLAYPLAALAQQKPMPVIGYLDGTAPGPGAPLVAAFRQGLSETVYVEGQSVVIEYRWAEGRYDRLPALAADLVGLKVRRDRDRQRRRDASGEKRNLDNPGRLLWWR